jgi:phospholipid/cholesterol/gamma-HCH transport system substrate-binding protein
VKTKRTEFVVGLFVLAGLLALLALAFNVSGLVMWSKQGYYPLVAEFDNVGDLKVRAVVSVGGVKVGRVEDIQLDPTNFRAKVTLWIDQQYNQFPVDTQAGILTQGLLGSNYISLTPGFEEDMLKPGGRIETTRSALVLEDLIGQLMYSLKGNTKQSSSDK